jgi:DNA transposition AAA+ family ATPase
MDTRETLLKAIDDFLSTSGMTQTALGERALNDPAFVTRFRDGADPRLGTVERLRRFMAEYTPPANPKHRPEYRAAP